MVRCNRLLCALPKKVGTKPHKDRGTKDDGCEGMDDTNSAVDHYGLSIELSCLSHDYMLQPIRRSRTRNACNSRFVVSGLLRAMQLNHGPSRHEKKRQCREDDQS